MTKNIKQHINPDPKDQSGANVLPAFRARFELHPVKAFVVCMLCRVRVRRCALNVLGLRLYYLPAGQERLQL